MLFPQAHPWPGSAPLSLPPPSWLERYFSGVSTPRASSSSPSVHLFYFLASCLRLQGTLGVNRYLFDFHVSPRPHTTCEIPLFVTAPPGPTRGLEHGASESVEPLRLLSASYRAGFTLGEEDTAGSVPEWSSIFQVHCLMKA